MRKLLAILVLIPALVSGNNGVMTNDAHQVIVKDNTMDFTGVTLTGVGGGASQVHVAKSASFTVTTADLGKVFEVTTGATNKVITLPSAAVAGNGFWLTIRKADSGTGLISNSETVGAIGIRGHEYELRSDGTAWYQRFHGGATNATADYQITSAGNMSLTPNGTGQLSGLWTASFSGGNYFALHDAQASIDVIKAMDASGTAKLGIFGAAPVAQQANTVTPFAALQNYGLLATGGTDPYARLSGPTFTGAVVVSLAGPTVRLTDTAGTGGAGTLAMAYGLNTGHTVMGWGPNSLLTHVGPTAINASYHANQWVAESNWIDGSGHVIGETYFTDEANSRVFGLGHDYTAGTADGFLRGRLLIDGSQTGMRADQTQSIMDVRDNSASLVRASVFNSHIGGSKAVDFVMGDGSTTGWAFRHDPAQSGVQYFGLYDSKLGTYPLVIDASDHVGINENSSTWTGTAALNVSGALLVSGGIGVGNNSPTSHANAHIGGVTGEGSGSDVPANTNLYLGAPVGGSTTYAQIRTSSFNGNPDYGFYLKTNYSSGSIATLGTRDGGADTDGLTIKGGVVGIPGLTASQFVKTDASKNLVSAAVTVPTIASTSNVLKGDGSGNAVAATAGTDFVGLASTNSLTGTNSFAHGTIVTSDPLLITQTWNASGTTFTGIKENVTSTASASGSLLIDLQVGGVSQLNVTKGGVLTTTGSILCPVNSRIGSSDFNSVFGPNADTAGGMGVIASSLYPLNAGATALGKSGNAWTKLFLEGTITGSGTTGNQTINKPTGTVRIAASGTSVTVTDNLCVTSSLVFATVRTNDSTAYVKNAIPAAGSFVINLGAAATSETEIQWFLINQ